jgi:hypothetical protein
MQDSPPEKGDSLFGFIVMFQDNDITIPSEQIMSCRFKSTFFPLWEVHTFNDEP